LLQIVGGLAAFWLAALALQGNPLIDRYIRMNPVALGLLVGIDRLLGVLLVVVGVIALVIGVGLWRLRNWARLIMMTLLILQFLGSAIGTIWAGAHRQTAVLEAAAIRMALDVAVIWYFSRPRVRDAFLPPSIASVPV
jgi:hypothetical protein